jgi:heparin/heparan-sulfate lyase
MSKLLLKKTIAFYTEQTKWKKAVSWYNTSRINALCAYDWLYNSLSLAERKRIGQALLDHIEKVQPVSGQKAISGRNVSNYTTGFYGTQSLLWFAGLACSGDGIDDDRSRKYLIKGFHSFQKLLKYRSKIAGDDGGLVTYSLNYALVYYPWAEFNFYHTMKSAFDINLAAQWPYMAYLVEYILWNSLPGNHWFGSGDAYHKNNKMPDRFLFTHLAQIRHFYGKSHPDLAALAGWIQGTLKNQKYAYIFPAVPLLLTGINYSPPAKNLEEFKLPSARHFENIGQIFLNSGWREDDTYALFTAGGISEKHKHFDENNFLIYKKGFLVLDTGSRPEKGSHLLNYFSRTVAHNAILIQMPGEVMSPYWGRSISDKNRTSIVNDGGQWKKVGAEILAFDTNEEFTYLASDATKVYHPAKCSLALRQFVFIVPNYFVILDRVISTRPEYKKIWLLHTANKPQFNGKIFKADQGGGRLYCRTFLPSDANIKVIGGPGKQFWTGDRNWAFPKGFKVSDKNELVGQWRVEVFPIKDEKEAIFLHFIEVGDREQLMQISESRLVRDNDGIGVEIISTTLTAKIMFHFEDFEEGIIRLKRQGKAEKIFNLVQKVKKQNNQSSIVRKSK